MEISKVKRIYLDQKDYIRIAHGLLGDRKYDTDVNTYDFLLELIKNNKIKIYYSWCHLKEAAGKRTHDQYLDKYIDVVLSLTDSNCIKDHALLIEMEIEILLAKKFNFTTHFDIQHYPYGQNGGLVFSEIDENFEEKIMGQRLSNQKKSRIRKELHKKNIYEARKLLPGIEDFTKNEIILLMAGKNSPERFRVVKKFLNKIFHLKFFLKNYSALGPIQNYLNYRSQKADELVDLIIY